MAIFDSYFDITRGYPLMAAALSLVLRTIEAVGSKGRPNGAGTSSLEWSLGISA